MILANHPQRRSLGLAAAFAILFNAPLHAQVRGPSPTTGADLPMTSGSGSRTETGSTTGSGGTSSTGSGSTITGSPAGTRMGSQGFGTGAYGPGGFSRGGLPAGMGTGGSLEGPGGGVHFPDDPSLIPFEAIGPSTPVNPSELSVIPPSLLRDARAIIDNGERALTLQRLAAAAIFSNELAEAHHALSEAADSALKLQPSLLQDQRLIGIITTLLNLAEADLREGKGETLAPEVAEALPPTPKVDRGTLIKRAELEWRRAAFLARRISDPTFRSELLYRVVDSVSYGAQTIAREFPSGGSRTGVKEAPESYDRIASRILHQAAREAQEIDRPVWRDRSLVEIAVNAAGGLQFKDSLEIARLIPQPEVRTDALVRVAEILTKPGGDPRLATETYAEAAQAVASIPLDDPRAVLAGVLIDNLISVGRFEDARASVVLYPDQARRMIALGAVAESQGRRGSADDARKWIGRDISPEFRSVLYRRVADGIIEAIEQNRSRALSRDR